MNGKREDTILIVDDNPTNLGVLFDFLRGQGFKVLVAEDGLDALEGIAYAKPDIILLDVIMPGLDGFETCRRLKANEESQDIPIIFMTALSETVDKVKGFTVGAVDYITKPIQVEEVLARVEAHLTIRNLQRTLQQQIMTYRQLLADELDVEPGSTIATLYKEIEATGKNGETRPLSPPALDVPNRLVFLFTDIEGSTRLWDTHRQAMLPALLRHNNILKQQIDRHGGRILELRGDGVKAVFEGGDPLPCVLEIQKQFGQEEWGAIDELRIRIGLHVVANTQEDRDYFRQGDQYYGSVLHHAARIMDAGWGGQILVSEEIKEAFALPRDAYWQDLGHHRLKSLETPQHIFGLLHPQLPLQDFPPLRTLTTQSEMSATGPLITGSLSDPAQSLWRESPRPTLRHNLPRFSFLPLGREELLATLIDYIRDPAMRLVNLTGAAGNGKSFLALAAAATFVKDRVAGVFFIPITIHNSADALVAAIMTALQLPLHNHRQPREQLLQYLHDKKMLLVLDGLEEGSSITFLKELLHVAPQLQLLVTTRVSLEMADVSILPVGSLSSLSAMTTFFQHIAQQATSTLLTKPADIVQQEVICKALQGNMLAIELVAAWTGNQALADIAESITIILSHSENALNGALDYVWGCLSEREQAILTALSLCHHRFDMAAAQIIAGADEATITHLVDKRLLQLYKAGWYRMPPAIRPYLRQKLAQHPQKQAIHEQHAHYYADLLCCYPEKWTETHLQLVREAAKDVDIAWRWALNQGRAETAQTFIIHLYSFYLKVGWFSEGQRVLSETAVALEHNPVWNDIPESKILAGMTLWRLGSLSLQLSQYDRAHTYLRRSLSMLLKAEKPHEVAQAWHHLGILSYVRGEYETAHRQQQSSLELAQAVEAPAAAAQAFNSLGVVEQALHNHAVALSHFQDSLRLYRSLSDWRGVAATLDRLGQLLQTMEQHNEARGYLQESLTLYQDERDRWGVASVLMGLGQLAQTQGTYWEAKQLLQESVSIRQEIGDRWGMAFALTHLGDTAVALGELEQSRVCFREATRLLLTFFVNDINTIRRRRHVVG